MLPCSVIVPARNAAASLPACLEALQRQEGLVFGQDYEVIVVDDGSTDGTPQAAEAWGAKVVSQPQRGPAAARNQGAALAQGEILAFTDADCVPAPDWLARLTAPFASADVVGVKGVYRTRERGLAPRFVQLEYSYKYTRMARQAKIDFIDTHSAAYRRSVFLANGGFDTTFPVPSVEDQEFSFRLARKGYTLVFQPQAAVYHRHDLDPGEYFRRKFGIGYWKAVMLRWLPEKAFNDSHTSPSQRWQIVILALTGISALLAAFGSIPPGFALALLAAFYLTALPFLVFILRSDPAVFPSALGWVLLRALALGTGLGVGLLARSGAPRPRNGLTWRQRAVKRLVDLLGALAGLVLSAPILLAAAIAIKLDSPGPFFFRQERIGEGGRPFRICKLRTMVADAEARLPALLDQNPLQGPAFKIPNDPRITRTGRFLRRWSLDELPQLWNVLRGDMSLVGPRPEETRMVAQYNDTQRLRLILKPGITGPMQVSGRAALDFDQRLLLELDYIEHYSLGRDLVILWRTLPAVLSGRGAS